MKDSGTKQQVDLRGQIIGIDKLVPLIDGEHDFLRVPR